MLFFKYIIKHVPKHTLRTCLRRSLVSRGPLLFYRIKVKKKNMKFHSKPLEEYIRYHYVYRA